MTETPESGTEGLEAAEKTVVPSEEQQNGEVATEAKPDDLRQRRDRRAERRIAKLTARNAALLERDAKRDQEIAELREKVEKVTAQQVERPQRDNYDSQEAYEDALLDYKLGQQPKPATAEPKADTALVDRFQSFIESNGDEFEKVVASAHFPLTDHALSEIIDMEEDGAAVFTHLNSNPAEAMRISRLSAREQTIELEKIADGLDTPEPEKDKGSKAPEPITPVDGNDKPTVDENRLGTDEWIARRNKKVFGR